MAKFGDLDEYFKPGLTLTVKGKEYVLPLPSAELGLWCRRATQIAGDIDAATSGDEMQSAVARAAELPPLPGKGRFEEQLLGHVYAQMIEDGVPDAYVQFCAQTAYIWVLAGEALAEQYWTSGGRPEARGPDNRADRRANARKTNTAAASATASQGSTSGTSSRRRSRRSGGADRSRGRSS